MIGVSLPYSWLLSGEGVPHLDRRELLTQLSRRGVGSVEIRTVLRDSRSEDVLSVAERLWNFGFEISVHSRMYSAETAVRDVFDPLRLLLANMRQKHLIIVLHAIVADNVGILRELSHHAEKMGYPVTIALENNRLFPDNREGDCASFVLDVVKAVNRPNVRLCFDFGHYIYYSKKHLGESGAILPSDEYLRLTVHTHIHALSGLETHYPLGEYELPLREMLEGVAWRYFGLYNIELDFPRLDGKVEPRSALLSSVDRLAEDLPLCAKLYDKIRGQFDASFKRAVEHQMEECHGGTTLSLANSTFYLFNTGGYYWAMDPAFRFANQLTDTPDRVAELLSHVRLMVVTHGHVDHFEESTVRRLAKCDMLWVIPDFLYDTAIEWGIRAEKIIVARENEPICIEKLTILPFKGRHFRPITHDGVDELGYYITADGAPSMVFPADVRDYSTDGMPDLPKADVCFLHVWLGDANSFASDYAERAAAIADYMTSLSEGCFIMAHLYENGRRDIDMWREEHADAIADAIKAKLPRAAIITPKLGERIDL